jgi:hypothetical protein
MSTEEVKQELIKSVVDFTGATGEKARKLLEESDWNVPEAVTRFFLEVDAVPSQSQPRQQTMPAPTRSSAINTGQPNLTSTDPADSSAVQALLMAIKSCMGWAASTCWSAVRWFLFGPSAQSGSGNLSSYFNQLPEGVARPLCLEETFQEATIRARARDNRKVVVVYLNSGSSNNFDFVTRSVLCDEAVVSVINEQFIFWAGDIDYSGPLQLLRALPIRSTPMLIAAVSLNTTELKIVGATAAPNFTVESVMGVLRKAQEAQDRLIAEDEQFRVNRDLRDAQDREYQEALERDRLAEEERQRKIDEEARKKEIESQKDQEKQKKLSAIQREKEAALKRVENAKPISSPTTIVVRLPAGIRIEKKFDKAEVVGTLYDWVLCCGLLHSHATEAAKAIRPGNFALSTSFPAKRLDNMNATLEELDLVPNAVLPFKILTDDSDDE